MSSEIFDNAKEYIKSIEKLDEEIVRRFYDACVASIHIPHSKKPFPNFYSMVMTGSSAVKYIADFMKIAEKRIGKIGAVHFCIY